MLEGEALLDQHLRSLVVGHARKGRLHALELGCVALEQLQLCRALVEHARHHARDQPLRQADHVVQIGVGHLGLDHPELGEVAARLALLRAEGRTEAIDLAEGHRVGLVVELSALREIRRDVIEVLHREERGRALARGRREDGRVGQDEAVVVEEVAHRVHHFVAHLQNGGLPLGANPQVTPVEQEVDAVLLRRNRVVVRGAHHVEARGHELVAALGARVGAHVAAYDDGGLLRQVVGLLEGLLADVVLAHHDLDEAGAVAHHQEVDLAARPAVVQPAREGDVLANVGADLRDGNVGNAHWLIKEGGDGDTDGAHDCQEF